jgi:hypothetical protein
MPEPESAPRAALSGPDVEKVPNVFISWSGDRSRAAANALASRLPDVIQSVVPFVSTRMPAGVFAASQMFRALQTCTFGIICVTTDNQEEPWLNFEAGALGLKFPEMNRITPYLLDDVVEADLKQPLSHFQAKRADKDGTLDLLHSINESVKNGRLTRDRLETAFDRGWDELNDALRAPLDAEPASPRRSDTEMLEELVLTVRELSRRVPDPLMNYFASTPALGASTSEIARSLTGASVQPPPAVDYSRYLVQALEVPPIAMIEMSVRQILGYDRVRSLGYTGDNTLLIELESEPTNQDWERVIGTEVLEGRVPRIMLTGPPAEEGPS